MTRVERPADATNNSYFLISGEGYPSILGNHLENAIRDIVSCGNYDYLVVVLDADESSVESRRIEVFDAVRECPVELTDAGLEVIVQNRCIETWLLGNKRMFSRSPQDSSLREYIRFYDVSLNDPEEMPLHEKFASHSRFHYNYLQLLFRERGLAYTKSRPGHAADGSYLERLIERVQVDNGHLLSFNNLVRLMEEWSGESTN
jgi:hypothetical protein